MLRRDTRLKAVRWRDLVELTWIERVWEVGLPLPWFVVSLWGYASGGWLWVVGAVGSFFFFLTGLRLSHNAQHGCLAIGRRGHDAVLGVLSVLMLASMHAVQATHLHHHRHCLEDDDIEAGHVGLPWWRAVLFGPVFAARLHLSAWRMTRGAKRGWIAGELCAVVGVIALVLWMTVEGAGGRVGEAAFWHIAAMVTGECLTAFFAVWIVHHGCEAEGQIARTQRGWLKSVMSYSMLYHLEHHLFPAVPTCHLDRLAARLDVVMPEVREKQVM